MHEHNVTNGHVTITAETATVADLFALSHELLDRLDRLEWAFSCLLMVGLFKWDIIGPPDDERAFRDTLGELHDWLHEYQQDQKKIERDRRHAKFMDAHE